MHLYLFLVDLLKTGSKGNKCYYITCNFALNTITHELTMRRYIYHRLWHVFASKRKSGGIDWKVWRWVWGV